MAEGGLKEPLRGLEPPFRVMKACKLSVREKKTGKRLENLKYTGNTISECMKKGLLRIKFLNVLYVCEYVVHVNKGLSDRG
jgi:hypothetical protein